MHPAGRQYLRHGAYERRGSPGQAHRLRLLRRPRVALRRFARHALEHDVADAGLAEDREIQFVDERGEGRLHAGPDPGRAEIEPVVARCAAVVHGQDAAPETVPGFEQLEVRACFPHQARRVEAGKSAADDGHLRIGQLRLLQARAKSKGWCRWRSTCLRVSDAKIADQVTVEFGEQVGVRLVGKGVAEIAGSHFADPLAVLVLVINHRGHDHLRHD